MDKELEQIAASVAKTLGLEKIEPEDYQVPHWKDGIFNSLLADGSNLFDPYWQVRCRDWILERGYHIDLDPLKTIGASHDIYTHKSFLWSLDCPASEFCARAIHELVDKQER